MMEKTQLAIGLQILVISILLHSTEAGNRREDLIQDSVRRLLGMKLGAEKSLVPGKNPTLPPQYVMDLYEKYRSGHTPMQGNTVRSILPIRDPIGEAEILIFNLTSIHSSEQILQSKLYILKRRKSKSGRKRDLSNFRLKIGNLPQMTSHRYIEVSLSHQKSEWHAYDITESVVQCRQSNKQKEQLLGVTLEVKRPKGTYRLVPFRRLLKHNSQPFVLTFSEDSVNRTRSSVKTGTRNGIRDLLSSKVDPSILPVGNFSNEQDVSGELFLRRKRSLYQSFTSHIPPERLNTSKSFYLNVFENSDEFSGKEKYSFDNLSGKIKKSLTQSTIYLAPSFALSRFNNSEMFQKLYHETEAPENPEASPKVLLTNRGEYITNNYDVLHKNDMKDSNVLKKWERKKRSISANLGLTTVSRNSKEEQADANAFQAIDDKHVPMLNSSAMSLPRRQNRQRNRRKHKKKKKRRHNRKLPFWWTKHDKNLHSQDFHKLCHKKSLIVDFEKLGWGDWVMSPKSFNAYYCSGGCSFPIIKDANPSNHAAIQSLVHAMRLGPNIPAPCCVPSITRPLTLLYFDENNSLVLKNYPNMIVEKCACR